MHTIDRARERYGLELIPADIFSMESQIAAGKALRVRHEPAGDVYLVRHGCTALVAVYK